MSNLPHRPPPEAAPDLPAEARAADDPGGADGMSRRGFLATAGVASASALLAADAHGAPAGVGLPVAPSAPTIPAPGEVAVRLRVNQVERLVHLDPRVTLLDALRENMQLAGTKKGCDHGQCGACTVLVKGRRVCSCLTLAVMHDGDDITTIEGLASGATLHPMQAAFIAHDAMQCGYCTPGQIMSAVGLLGEPCGPEDADVKTGMCGNLCRCGAYPNIVAAVQTVRRATPAAQ